MSGRTVVFVAPYLLDATARFVSAVARLPNTRTALISVDPLGAIVPELRARLAWHEQLPEPGLDPQRIADAVRAVQRRLGPVERLVATLEQLQVPIAEVREALGIPGMGVEAALNFRDKARMKERLRAAGLPCARHRLIQNANEGIEFGRTVGYPLVVKPPAGAGASQTFRVADEQQLGGALDALAPSPSRPVLCEEFVRGLERSFDAVTIGGQPRWHSLTRYTPTPLDVLNNPWIQWTVVLPREVDDPGYDDVRKVGYDALRVLGMDQGISHMEWFRRLDNSVAISEIGARPPGARFMHLMSHAHDVDFFGVWARVVVWGEFEPPPRRYAAGAAYLRGQGTGRVAAIAGLERAQREIGHLVVEAQLPRGGAVPSSSYEGDGYVIVRHPDTAVVEQALAKLISTVRVELS